MRQRAAFFLALAIGVVVLAAVVVFALLQSGLI